jgi:hypothetical protein
MSSVFVSYSRTDLARVEVIASDLEQHGYIIWWDRMLRGGEDFGGSIEAALADSRCAVVAWSRTARNSLWVRAEANYARETGKLVQITLDGSQPPLPFSMLHTLDFSPASDIAPESIRQLTRSIDLTVAGVVPETIAADRHDPLRTQSRLAGFAPVAGVGGAAISLTILAGGLVMLASRKELPANAFSVATSALFLAAILAFGFMLTRVITTYLASKK